MNKYAPVYTIMTNNRKVTNARKEEIIDLTDIGHNNKMPVIRELEQDPVTGVVTMRSINDSPVSTLDNEPIQFIQEDKGQGYREPYTPPEIDGDYESKLEAEGAFIIESKTHYPASNTTVTKRSQTPAEIAEERGYHGFYERYVNIKQKYLGFV